MKKMFKLLWAILKDERGIAPWIPAAIMGGSTLLGGILGRRKGQGMQEPWPGYFGLGGALSGLVQGRLGQQGTRYPGTFNIPQPGIEAQTESILSGKLGNLPSPKEYESKVEAKKQAGIKSLTERYKEKEEEEANMYNRLGLVSSTPWLTRKGEIGEERESAITDYGTGMDIYGLEYGLQADELAEQIANQYLTQGQVLGGRQRGYEQYPIQMGYEDWLRAYQEPYQWAGLGAGMLGGNAPQYSAGTPNIWSQIGQSGQDIGTMIMLYNLLGGGGGTPNQYANVSGLGRVRKAPPNYYLR